jgi:hypothetical protein
MNCQVLLITTTFDILVFDSQRARFRGDLREKQIAPLGFTEGNEQSGRSTQNDNYPTLKNEGWGTRKTKADRSAFGPRDDSAETEKRDSSTARPDRKSKGAIPRRKGAIGTLGSE